MGGPPVDNVAISVEGERTLTRLFIPAGIVGLSLAFWCLRSARLTLMVFVAALYAGAMSLAIVYYSGGDDERHHADHAGRGLRGGHLRRDPLCQLLSRFGGRKRHRRARRPAPSTTPGCPCTLSAVHDVRRD